MAWQKVLLNDGAEDNSNDEFNVLFFFTVAVSLSNLVCKKCNVILISMLHSRTSIALKS